MSLIAVNYKLKCVNLEPALTEPNVQKHNQRLERSSLPRDRTKSRREYTCILHLYKCNRFVLYGKSKMIKICNIKL